MSTTPGRHARQSAIQRHGRAARDAARRAFRRVCELARHALVQLENLPFYPAVLGVACGTALVVGLFLGAILF